MCFKNTVLSPFLFLFFPHPKPPTNPGNVTKKFNISPPPWFQKTGFFQITHLFTTKPSPQTFPTPRSSVGASPNKWRPFPSTYNFVLPNSRRDPGLLKVPSPYVGRYLEDHPSGCKWLESPLFISHKKPIWKGNNPT